MTFSERMKDLLDQGVIVTKDIAAKTGAKAKDLGERGVLTLEIKQLEGQAQKLITRLGNTAYESFVEKGAKTISIDTPAVKALLTELASTKEAIEKREIELEARKK